MRLKIPESYRLEPEIRNYFKIERILSQAVICLRDDGYVMLVFSFPGKNWNKIGGRKNSTSSFFQVM